MTGSLAVLYEDNHLLVVNKPALLPTMGVAAGEPSLLETAREYIRQKYNKPGNVYLGIVSRLDAPVTGAVVIARTSKAAARLSEQFRRKSVEKIYWAVVENQPGKKQAELTDWLRKDERHRKVVAVASPGKNDQQARLCYALLKNLPPQAGGGTLLEVRLETGRKHQIRVQLSSRDLAIVGDRKYGARRQFSCGIALHARRIGFEHPTTKKSIELIAPLPTSWEMFGIEETG